MDFFSFTTVFLSSFLSVSDISMVIFFVKNPELLRFYNIHRNAVYGQERLSYSKFVDSLQENRYYLPYFQHQQLSIKDVPLSLQKHRLVQVCQIGLFRPMAGAYEMCKSESIIKLVL